MWCFTSHIQMVKPSSQYDARPRDATCCDVVQLSLKIDFFFYSERRRTTCRSRRRCHAKLYRRAGKFWHDVASRHGALRRLASYCELGLSVCVCVCVLCMCECVCVCMCVLCMCECVCVCVCVCVLRACECVFSTPTDNLAC